MRTRLNFFPDIDRPHRPPASGRAQHRHRRTSVKDRPTFTYGALALCDASRRDGGSRDYHRLRSGRGRHASPCRVAPLAPLRDLTEPQIPPQDPLRREDPRLSPRVGFESPIDLLLVLCAENQEYLGGFFERSSKSCQSCCLQLVHEDTVSFPLRLRFERFLRIVWRPYRRNTAKTLLLLSIAGQLLCRCSCMQAIFGDVAGSRKGSRVDAR